MPIRLTRPSLFLYQFSYYLNILSVHRIILGNSKNSDTKMIGNINYYEILGVPEDALLKEIQRAWRKFVKENHEDLVPQWQQQAAKERMFQINEAYGAGTKPRQES